VEVREAIGDKFPKHIYHSIICIGALVAHREPDGWVSIGRDRDPLSASKRDPFGRRVLLVALAPSELVGVAETARARVVW
jgi:hypothetical protein